MENVSMFIARCYASAVICSVPVSVRW